MTVIPDDTSKFTVGVVTDVARALDGHSACLAAGER